jgi:hypothetical protein
MHGTTNLQAAKQTILFKTTFQHHALSAIWKHLDELFAAKAQRNASLVPWVTEMLKQTPAVRSSIGVIV